MHYIEILNGMIFLHTVDKNDGEELLQTLQSKLDEEMSKAEGLRLQLEDAAETEEELVEQLGGERSTTEELRGQLDVAEKMLEELRENLEEEHCTAEDLRGQLNEDVRVIEDLREQLTEELSIRESLNDAISAKEVEMADMLEREDQLRLTSKVDELPNSCYLVTAQGQIMTSTY